MATLFVDTIKSIGAVPDGDNPDASITFWKSKGSPTAASDAAKVESTSVDSASRHRRATMSDNIRTLPASELLKGSPPQVQGAFAKMETRLNEEILKRRDTEFIAKVKDTRGLVALLGDPDEIGPALRELDDANPEAFGKVFDALQTAATRLDVAQVLSLEKGRSSGEGADPISQRDAWITKQRDAGDARTDAELAADFWQSNPAQRDALREGK